MRDDFCAFILTHGRADRVLTYDTLKRCGYTGKIYIVIDDEDSQADQYRAKYGAKVLQFSKAEIESKFDVGDNFKGRRGVIYARNACWDLARKIGCKYFIQLDDDYRVFNYKFDSKNKYVEHRIMSLDAILDICLDYFIETSFSTIAFAQGGDHLGGSSGSYAKSIKTVRKAMNTFICDTDRKFSFVGRINEDVNTYVCKQISGISFLTLLGLEVKQNQTQAHKGGMTELYLDEGTYVKSFYSVVYAPGCVKVALMGNTDKRLHHSINWNATAPKIIREKHRKRNLSNATQAA